MCVSFSACMCAVHVRVESPGTGGIDSYELTSVGAGNRTWTLCKSSVCSSIEPSLQPPLFLVITSYLTS